MDAGLLSLKWNNHSSTFFHVLETIRKKELYSDVTVACDGKFFAVHKLVLSTCSDYFQEMFEKTQCKHPIIVLKDISHTDLESLLNYMYIGEVNVLQNELSSLIKAAECLKVKGLAVPDEPPPSKKSSKRQTEREESSSNKRNRRSNSTTGEQASDQRDNGTDSSSQNDRVRSQNLSNEQDSSIKEFNPLLIVKEEKQDEMENFANESVMNSVVKFEQFDDDVSNPNPGALNPNLDSKESFSSQQQQPIDGGGGQNFPSTSAYDDSSNWSGDIETIDDDDDDGGGEMGNFDPNSFLDPSQAKSQMESRLLECLKIALPHQEPSNKIEDFVKRDGSFWPCSFSGCAYQVLRKSDLMKHLMKHIGFKPYVCQFCGYATNQSSNVYSHYKRKHNLVFPSKDSNPSEKNS